MDLNEDDIDEALKDAQFGPKPAEHSPLFSVLNELKVADERLEAKTRFLIEVEELWAKIIELDNRVRAGEIAPLLVMLTTQMEFMPHMVRLTNRAAEIFRDDGIEDVMDTYNKAHGAITIEEQRKLYEAEERAEAEIEDSLPNLDKVIAETVELKKLAKEWKKLDKDEVN